MIDSKSQNSASTSDGMSFGGIIPDTTDHPSGDFSLSEAPAAPEGEYSLVGSNEHFTATSGDIADRRAAKVQFSLGGEAPDPNVIKNLLMTGQEATLRHQIAESEDIKDANAKIGLVKDAISSGVTSDPQKLDVLENVIKFKPQNDPNTILEKAFARTYISLLSDLKPETENVVREGYKKNPEHTHLSADIAEELTLKQEIAKSAHEDMEQRLKDQSWGGWAVDLAKGFVPGYSWIKTFNAVNAPTSPILKGNNWAEQINYLYSLEPKDMHRVLRETLDKMSEGNPQLAAEFAGAVTSFTTTDQFLSNTSAVVDVASVVPIGKSYQVLKKGVSLVAGREVETAATNALKSAVEANAYPSTNVADTLARVGDTSTSALLNTVKRADEILSRVEVPLAKEQVQSRLFSLFNPHAIEAGGSNLSAMETQRIIQKLEANADKVTQRLQDLGKIDRLSQEALSVAFKEAQKSLEQDMAHVNGGILDVRFNLPENSSANVGSVSAVLGDRDGKTFASQFSAYQYAKGFYKLHPDDINIEQKGVGFLIRVDRNIDETLSSVREALNISTNTQTPQTMPGMVLGWLRSANDKVSQHQIEQRIMAVSGYSGLTEAMKDIGKTIGTLSKGEHARVARVMEANRSWVDPNTGKIGMFHDDIASFEREFKSLNSQYPTPKETQAYFSAVQINDLDYIMRNMSLYRDRARQGLREIVLHDKTFNERGEVINFEAPKFLGKEVKELPLDQQQHGASVLIHRMNGETERFRLWDLQSSEKRAYIKSLMDDGYKAIQTHNPAREIAGGKYGTDPVNFIITKDYKAKNLDFQQLPYQPGFHREYDQKYYVKQPLIRQGTVDGQVTHHEFDGDRTVFGFYSKPEADKYAKAMEEARQIYSGEKIGNLGEFLSKNLPFSEGKFKSLFEDSLSADGKVVAAQYSKEHPFLSVYDRQTTVDAHGNLLRDRFQNLNDNIRSPWNLMANEDKKFVGQKDPDMWTIREASGTEGNPTFQLASANTIDAWSSLSRGMANIMRNRFMADYKTQAVESWVNEFGHLIETASKEDLLNNAMYHVFQPQWKRINEDNAVQMAAAKNSRRAIMEFLGNEAPEQTAIGSIKQKIVDMAYNAGGQRVSDVVADHLLAAEVDPLKAMRGFAFHTTIGLFNPVQLWQNLNTMSFTVGIGGFKNGVPGSVAGQLMRFAMVNQNPQVLSKLASIAETVSAGRFKQEWFKESWKELQKTGRMFVEGEHAWRDDVANPKFFDGKFGSFLDKGQVFFREGERATRLAAWNTAFLEWRITNPNAQLTNAVRNQILARSDDMGANMTRASSAAWQQGILSVPAQFTSYPIRIMELMVGKRLSFEEKARMMAVQSALYGIPMGTTGTILGGVYDAYQDIREASLRNNWNMSDGMVDALHSGIMGVVGNYLTGRTSSLGDKAGPGGNSILREALSGDKDLIDLALGASGSKTKDALTSVKPVLRSFIDFASGKEDKFSFAPADALDLARNVQSVDIAARTYMAVTTGKLITKNGTYQGDVTPMEAILGAFTGGQPRAISDVKLMKNWGKTREKAIEEIQKEVTKWHSFALGAAEKGDQTNYGIYMKRINSLIQTGDLRPEEQAAMMKKTWETNVSQAAKVPYDFFVKKAPPSVAPGATERFIQSNPNPVK